MADGKVTICTALDNSDIEKDVQEVSGEFGGLEKVLSRMSKTIAGAMEKPVSEACSKIRKDLTAVEKQIAQYQKQIQKAESAKMPLEEQASQLGVALDAAKAKLAELQEKQASAEGILSAAGNRELSGPEIDTYVDTVAQKPALDAAVIEQKAQVDALQKKWDACNNKIDEYTYKIDQANQEMVAQQSTAEELRQKLGAAEKETKKIRKNVSGSQKEMGVMAKEAKKFSSRLKSIALGALLFNGISAGFREVTEHLKKTLMVNEDFTSELANLKGALLTAFQPIYSVVTPAVTSLMKKLTAATYIVAEFFASLSGKSLQSNAAAAEVLYEQAKSLDKVEKNAKKAAKAFARFDEVNVLQESNKNTGVGESEETVSPNFNMGDWAGGELEKTADQIKEKMKAILVLVGLVGAGMLTWKILDIYTDADKLKKVLSSLPNTLKNVGSTALIVAGAILLIKGYCDGWVNGVGWDDLLLVLGGIALVLTGITIKFGSLGLTIGTLAAGVALLVLGVKDFITNGPSVQNTILIIGGAIATAVGLATAGLSVVVAAIIGAIAAVAAFTAAILLEEPAIKTVQEAQENLTAAKEAAAEAEINYISAVDSAESAVKRLEDAEKAAGTTGEELYNQVQAGTLDYANMTAAQKEAYKAYLDNETKQKELEETTRKLNEAKKAETLASFENQLALAKESGSYDDFKKSVVAAFEAGELSADEAREMIGKSMSEMGDDAQKTFMEDIPGSIKDGLDPSKYETTRKKIGDWFSGVGKFCVEKIWQPITKWWNDKVKPIFTKKFWTDKFESIKNGAKAALNGAIDVVEKAINFIIKKLNTLSWDVPYWVPLIGGEKFGFNIKPVSIPRLAQGAVIPPNREFMAVLGDQKHGTNIEAPLETIKQALAEVLSMQESGNVTIEFRGELAQLARILMPVIKKEEKRVGVPLIRKAGV